jgi:hypothetical protein
MAIRCSVSNSVTRIIFADLQRGLHDDAPAEAGARRVIVSATLVCVSDADVATSTAGGKASSNPSFLGAPASARARPLATHQGVSGRGGGSGINGVEYSPAPRGGCGR